MLSDVVCDEAPTLFAWIGGTDLKVASGSEVGEGASGLGPIGRVVARRLLKRVILLDDRGAKEPGQRYAAWLQDRCGSEVDVAYKSAELNGPTSLDDIYRKAKDILDESGVRSPLFLISSGTSAMGFVWMLLASRYNGKLLESSIEGDVLEIVNPLSDYEAVMLPGLQSAHRRGGDIQPQLFFAWLGGMDRRASYGGSLGPVAGFLSRRPHHEIVLLYEENDRSRERSEGYCDWLQERLARNATVFKEPVNLVEKTISHIHAETLGVVQKWRGWRRDPAMTCLVSSGMPAMRIAWHLVALAYPKAELWETFSQHGREHVSRVVWPLL